MCAPLAIPLIGMAISAAASMGAANAAHNNQAGMINARNQSNIDAAKRSEGYQKQANDVMDSTLAPYQNGNAAATEAQATADRQANLTGAMNPAAAAYNPSFGGNGAPTVVKGELARKTAQMLDRGRQSIKGLAAQGGNADFHFGNMVNLGRSGSQLTDIGQLASGSASLLPIEQQTAITNAYNPPSPMYGIANTVGQGMTAFGGGGIGGAGLTADVIGGQKGVAWNRAMAS